MIKQIKYFWILLLVSSTMLSASSTQIIDSISIYHNLSEQHFAKNLKPQSFQNQGIALFFLYFSQVRGLSRTLK